MRKGSNIIFSRKSDLWETPQYLFDRYNEKYHFTIDVCADEKNHKCDKYFTKLDNGLEQKWSGICWCNPPYSEINDWIFKAIKEQYSGITTVMLVPSRTDVKWFHQYIYKNADIEIIFIKGRLKFGSSKWNAPFPSMILIFKSQMQQKLF